MAWRQRLKKQRTEQIFISGSSCTVNIFFGNCHLRLLTQPIVSLNIKTFKDTILYFYLPHTSPWLSIFCSLLPSCSVFVLKKVVLHTLALTTRVVLYCWLSGLWLSTHKLWTFLKFKQEGPKLSLMLPLKRGVPEQGDSRVKHEP